MTNSRYPHARPYGKGFRLTSALVQRDVRRAGESRGFAVSRLLTHWAEIVGADVARIARPVKVSYGRGFGATLTLLTTGANAPLLEMQRERIREKVNACYGYAAIARVRITQTAPSGFSEGRAQFGPESAPRPSNSDPEIVRAAEGATATVGDDALRAALNRLAVNVLGAKTSR